MFKRQFWKETFERAVKTAAQLAAAGLGAQAAGILDMTGLQAVGAGALTGFVLSVLTSVASAPLGPEDSASVVQKD